MLSSPSWTALGLPDRSFSSGKSSMKLEVRCNSGREAQYGLKSDRFLLISPDSAFVNTAGSPLYFGTSENKYSIHYHPDRIFKQRYVTYHSGKCQLRGYAAIAVCRSRPTESFSSNEEETCWRSQKTNTSPCYLRLSCLDSSCNPSLFLRVKS